MKPAAFAFSVICAASLATPSVADDTGFATSHDLRKEGGKNCMSDHAHYGSGDGASKNIARQSAIKSWFEYTSWEYGTDWARWGKSVAQKVNYTKAEKGWTATVESRPCK